MEPDVSPSSTELLDEGRVQIIGFGKEIGVSKVYYGFIWRYRRVGPGLSIKKPSFGYHVGHWLQGSSWAFSFLQPDRLHCPVRNPCSLSTLQGPL